MCVAAAELDQLHEAASTVNSLEQRAVPARRRRRTLTLTNGFDPTTTSEYYDEYMRLKSLREQYERRFEARQRRRLQDRRKLHEAIEQAFTGDSLQHDMASALIDEQLSIAHDDSYKHVKSLNDIISRCISSNEDLLFLGDPETAAAEPQVCKQFRAKIRDLLSKYIQISLINSVNTASQNQGDAINLMNADKSDKFEFIDGLLSDKVNSAYVHKVVQNVKPALRATTIKSIDEQARALLYAIDYKHNLSNMLAQLYEADRYPEYAQAHGVSHFLLEHFKDDADVLELLKQRPANSLMYKGKQNIAVMTKVANKMIDVASQSPIEILKLVLESIIKTGFDVTYGDADKRKDISHRLSKHLGPLDDPIRDAVTYAAWLVTAHDFMDAQQCSDAQAIESCINLLANSKHTQYEVDTLIRSIHKQLAAKAGNTADFDQALGQSADASTSLLSDYLDSSCDVESLYKIKQSSVGHPSSSDIGVVIDYINDALQHTPNVRRQRISISEFLNRDSTINLEFVNNVADCVLNEQTKRLADKLRLHKEAGLDIHQVDLLSDDVKQLLRDTIDDKHARVIDKTTLQPYNRLVSTDSLIDDKIKQDIANAVSMSDDLEFTRAKSENHIIEAMMSNTSPTQRVNSIVSDWIKLRVIDLKTKPEYKLLCDSEFKTQLIDSFKQQIISELGLNNYDLAPVEYQTINPVDARDKTAYANDIANKNNLNCVMHNALGYDNLVARLQDPDNTAGLAQSNYFESMLAQYYIDKRRDYKASNDMLDTLNTIFNVGSIYNQSQRIGEDLDTQTAKLSSPHTYDGLGAYTFMAYVNKGKPALLPEDANRLIELGDATSHAMFGEVQGVAQSLAQYNTKHNTWPERLPKFDARTSPKQWVERKLSEVISKIFAARQAVEQSMTRNELKAYDKQMAHHFSKQTMILRLLDELDLEFAELTQLKISHKLKQQHSIDKQVQDSKSA